MKRLPELRKLSQDHHHGLVLARRACRAASGAPGLSVPKAWREVERRFHQELEPHFKIEEKYLAPLLEEVGEAPLVSRLREEHSLLRELVQGWSERNAEGLAEFGRLLEGHIRFEERELFETAQIRLPAGALEPLARACREAGKPAGRRAGSCPGGPHD